jgi:hypothetical protein
VTPFEVRHDPLPRTEPIPTHDDEVATEPVTSSGLTIVSGGTDAGERLIARIGPRLDEIEDELAALSALRDKPAGTIRITTAEHATATILSPVLHRLLPDHPAIIVEVAIDNGLTDIVAERYDAGIRLGEQVERGMMAFRGRTSGWRWSRRRLISTRGRSLSGLRNSPSTNASTSAGRPGAGSMLGSRA